MRQKWKAPRLICRSGPARRERKRAERVLRSNWLWYHTKANEPRPQKPGPRTRTRNLTRTEKDAESRKQKAHAHYTHTDSQKHTRRNVLEAQWAGSSVTGRVGGHSRMGPGEARAFCWPMRGARGNPESLCVLGRSPGGLGWRVRQAHKHCPDSSYRRCGVRQGSELGVKGRARGRDPESSRRGAG